MFTLTGEINVLFKGLRRDGQGNLCQTAPKSAGYAAGPQSQFDLANRAKVHAQCLSTAAVRAKGDGRLVEGRLLQNQADFELAALARDMASRSVDRANDNERRQEAEERRDAAHAEMERLQTEAHELDKQYAEKTTHERRQAEPQAERNDRSEQRRELAEQQAKVKREYGNVFREQCVSEKLRELKASNDRVDISQIEATDPRLGRRADGTLDGQYIENSADTKGRRRNTRDYVRDLQDEARSWQGKGNDVVADRYRVQAELESAQARNRSQDATRDEPRIRKANEDLALVDMRDRGPHMGTVEQRLAANNSRHKSEWVPDIYQASELRAGLRPDLQDSYDHYRSRVAAQVAEKRGADPKGYQLTKEEVARFDKAFTSYATEFKRDHEVVRQERRREGSQSNRVPAPHSEQQPQDEPLRKPQELNAKEREVERQTGKPVPREVEGHKAEQSQDLTQVKYIRERDCAHTMTDVGKAVRFEKEHKHDMDAIRSGLSLADSKFNSIGVRSQDEKFRALTAKASVEMGLDSKIKSQDMVPFIEAARKEREAEQRQGNETTIKEKREQVSAPEQQLERRESERANEVHHQPQQRAQKQESKQGQAGADAPGPRSRAWATMASAARERESEGGMWKPAAERTQDKLQSKDAQPEVDPAVQCPSVQSSEKAESTTQEKAAEEAPEQQKEAGRAARSWAAQASSARERETEIANAQPRTRGEDEELSR